MRDGPFRSTEDIFRILIPNARKEQLRELFKNKPRDVHIVSFNSSYDVVRGTIQYLREAGVIRYDNIEFHLRDELNPHDSHMPLLDEKCARKLLYIKKIHQNELRDLVFIDDSFDRDVVTNTISKIGDDGILTDTRFRFHQASMEGLGDPVKKEEVLYIDFDNTITTMTGDYESTLFSVAKQIADGYFDFNAYAESPLGHDLSEFDTSPHR